MNLAIALSGLSITLLGALMGVIWRAASLVTKMSLTLNELRANVHRLEEGLSRLEKIPVLEQRVSTLEHVAEEQSSRVGVLWDKVFSLRMAIERHSSPEIDPKSQGSCR